MPLLFALGHTMRSQRYRTSYDPENSSSPFWMTCMLSAVPKRLVGSTLYWRTRYGDMPASRCMQARRKCGIARASDQQLATSLNGEHTLRWNGHECGEEGWKQRRENVVSKSWGHLSDIRSSSRISCRRSVNTSKPSWTEFPPSLTCSLRGLCCCIVQQQEPIISSGLCRLTVHTRSRWPMMTRCGDVSVLSCGSCALGRLLRCHSPSVALASAVPSALLQRPTGPVGASCREVCAGVGRLV